MKREFTDPDEVGHDDVELDGVEYNPGKIWTEAIEYWMHDGFRKVDRPDSSELLADRERLEQLNAINRDFPVDFREIPLLTYIVITNFAAKSQI